jgi:hypothetical protein
MTRWMRRTALLGLLGGGGWAGYSAWRKRDSTATQPSSWQPSPGDGHRPATADPIAQNVAENLVENVTSNGVADVGSAIQAEKRWAPPIEGQCPAGFPVKANDNSRIFHVPGGRFYERTVPERCYANASDAEADGYRPAKA